MPRNRRKIQSPAHRLQVQSPEDEQVVSKTEEVPGYRSQSEPPEAGPSHVSIVPIPPAPIVAAGSAQSPLPDAESGRTSLDSPPPATNPSPTIPNIAGGLKSALQSMVEGNVAYSYEEQQLEKRYLALDSKSFEEIRSRVAGLLKDKVLVGHDVFHDLKALSLKHPRPQILDTQFCAWKHKVSTAKRIALRHLVKQELGLTIQDGEHSSVTDARATMAVFRLHEREWEKDLRFNKNTGARVQEPECAREPKPHSQQGSVAGLSGGPNKSKGKSKKKKRKVDERNGLGLESQAALNLGRGGSALGSQSGVGWVWGWDPEPGEPWAGWEEEPKSRPGLGYNSGSATGRFHWVSAFQDDDMKYWGRDANQGWPW
ncbi:3'-5' exonuclease [Pleurotus pulmonarius]|nr:3'-5' exonuclease [Pleurotus pulmonarius]